MQASAQRKPYNRPAITKLTPEDAKSELEAKPAPGCENAQQLLDALKKRRISGAPRPGIVRKIAFVVALILLFAAPVVLLTTAVSAELALRDSLARLTVFWFPLWALFAVWVTLDAVAFYGFIGPRPDPLGPKALGLSALGVVNLGAMLLFVILTRGR